MLKIFPTLVYRLSWKYSRVVSVAYRIRQSIASNAAPAWTGTASDTNLLRLQVIQNKCLRMALNLPPWTPIRDLHKEAKIPHLGDTILRMTDKFYEKTKTSDNPYIRGAHLEYTKN